MGKGLNDSDTLIVHVEEHGGGRGGAAYDVDDGSETGSRVGGGGGALERHSMQEEKGGEEKDGGGGSGRALHVHGRGGGSGRVGQVLFSAHRAVIGDLVGVLVHPNDEAVAEAARAFGNLSRDTQIRRFMAVSQSS